MLDISLEDAIRVVVAHGDRAARAALVARAIAAHDGRRALAVMADKAEKAATSAARGWNTGSTTQTVRAAADRAEMWRDRAALAAGLAPFVIEMAGGLVNDWRGAPGDLIAAASVL